MDKLHTAGLEGYMCVNVLVYESELALAEQLARSAEAAGVDGLIVQAHGRARARVCTCKCYISSSHIHMPCAHATWTCTQ